MNQDDLIVSKTDLKGRITYGNAAFIRISGYSEKELLHTPHNILRHNEMPRIVFKLLWDRIKEKKTINAYVKNKTKSGDFYWVFANVSASFDLKNTTIGYYSVRRKPLRKAIEAITLLYQQLLIAEQQGGINASSKLLNDTLKNAGVNYDEFIVNLQK